MMKKKHAIPEKMVSGLVVGNKAFQVIHFVNTRLFQENILVRHICKKRDLMAIIKKEIKTFPLVLKTGALRKNNKRPSFKHKLHFASSFFLSCPLHQQVITYRKLNVIDSLSQEVLESSERIFFHGKGEGGQGLLLRVDTDVHPTIQFYNIRRVKQGQRKTSKLNDTCLKRCYFY